MAALGICLLNLYVLTIVLLIAVLRSLHCLGLEEVTDVIYVTVGMMRPVIREWASLRDKRGPRTLLEKSRH